MTRIFCCFLLSLSAWSQTQDDMLATSRFEMKRLGLTLSPEHQTVLLGFNESPLSFRLAYDGALQSGMRIKAGLTGSGLSAPVQVDVPADQLRIDLDRSVFTTIGSYELIDVRLVNAADQVIEFAEPRNAKIDVIDDVFVTRVEVRELSLEELLELGYVFNKADYHSVSFTLNLVIGSREETVTTNVVYPKVKNDRFKPLVITDPFKPYVRAIPMEIFLPEYDVPYADFTPPAPSEFRGDGLLIIPGNFNYLKSHFGVTAVILNKGPQGLDVRLERLKSKIVLPDATIYGEPLATNQSRSQDMINVGPDGERDTPDDRNFADPGEEASSQYVLIGNIEGMYDVDVEITGDVALTSETIPIRSTAHARVFVRNPNFSVTFEHPDAVAEDEAYDLHMHVSNTSESNLSGFSVTLDPFRMVGVQLDTGVNPIQTLATLPPGGEGTITYRLRSNTAGKVLASYLKIDGAPSGQVDLYVGVGESGEVITPYVFNYPPIFNLFPASLTSPLRRLAKKGMDFAQMTSDTLPLELQPISPAAVRELNDQMVRAAQLQTFQAPYQESLIQLFGTWLHGVKGYEPIDLLRRKLISEGTVDPRSAFASEFESSFQFTSPETIARTIAQELDAQTNQIGVVINASQPGLTVRVTDGSGRSLGHGLPDQIPFGTFLRLSDEQSLIWISAATETPIIELQAPDGTNVQVAAIFPGSSNTLFALLPPFTLNGALQIGFEPSRSQLVLNPADQPAFNLAASTLPGKAIELREVKQVDPTLGRFADGYGRHVMFPFTAELDLSSLQPIEDHIWINGEPAVDASLQKDGRTLFVSARMPLGPYRDIDYRIEGARSKSGSTMAVGQGLVTASSWFIGVSVEGRVVDHAGSDLDDAEVMLFLPNTTHSDDPNQPFRVFARSKLDSSGAYNFDFVPFLPFSQSNQGQNRATGAVRVGVQTADGRFRFEELWPGGAGQTLRADFAFLHQGDVEGYVFHNGEPVPFAPIFVQHNNDPVQNRETTTDQNGFYRVTGIDVGPITVRALANNTLGLRSGYLTQAESPLRLDVYVDTPEGALTGLIQFESEGQDLPLADAFVVFARYGDVLSEFEIAGFSFQASAVSQTGADGRFLMEHIPAGFGQLTLLSRQFGMKQVELTISPGAVEVFNWTYQVDDDLEYGGIARGRVLVDGFGFEGAWVAAAGRGVQTNASGQFELLDLPLDQFLSLNLFMPGSSTPNATFDIFLAKTNPIVENLEFNMNAAITVSGLLHDELDQPVPFAPIFSPPYIERVRPVAETNASGEWSYRSTKRGHVNLTAIRQPHIAETEIFVQDDDIYGLIIRETASSALKVRVFDPDGNPILAKVRLKSLSPILHPDSYGKAQYGLTHDLLTDATGVIDFPELNSGDFEVWASNPLYGDTNHFTGYLAPRTPDDPIVISLSFQQATLANLFGTVFDAQGFPVADGIHVQARFDNIFAPIRTNPSGDYRYESLVNSNDPTRVELLAYNPQTDQFAVSRIDLRQGLNYRQDLVLKNRRNVIVRVEDHEGQPADFAAVQIEYNNVLFTPPADPSDPLSFGEADLRRVVDIDQVTLNDPAAQFDSVPLGEFTIRASSGNGLAALRSFILPNLPGDFEVVVRLEAASRISGTFFDHGDQPIADAEVELKQGSRVLQQHLTEGASGDVGHFEFDELPMRTYQLEGLDPTTAFTGRATATTSSFHPDVEVDLRLDPIAHLAGTVFFAGSPVVGATVELAGSGILLSTGTDDLGRYQFANLPLNNYQLSASKLGIPSTVARTTVTLSEANVEHIQDLFFIETKDVDVLVLDPDGVPLQDILVTMAASSGQTGFGDIAYSDEEGIAHFTDITPARYQLEAESPQGFSDATGTLVVASLDYSPVWHSLQFPGIGSVSGHVLLSSGQPPGQTLVVTVETRNFVGNWYSLSSLPANQDGSFFMPGLNVGQGYRFSVADPSTRQSDSLKVTLDFHGENRAIDLTLQETTYITGLVRRADGSAAPHVRVTLNEPFFDIAYTDGLGEFYLEPVPAGSFELIAEDPLSPRLARYQGEILTDANGFPIPANIELTLGGLATVNGMVRLGDGSPVTFGEMRLQAESTGVITTPIQADGSYLFSLVPLGNYQLTAFDGELIAYSAAQTVLLDVDGGSATFDVDFPASYQLSGHLFMPPTQLVAGGTVELWKRPAGSTQYLLVYRATTDEFAAFGFDHVYPGSYQLKASNASLSALASYAISMPSGPWVHDVYLTERATVIGQVMDGSLRPFTSGSLQVTQFCLTQSVSIGPDGGFFLDNLVPGDVTFVASLVSGWFNIDQTVTLGAGTNAINLQSQPSVDIAGQAIVISPLTLVPQVSFSYNGRSRGVSLNASGDFVLSRAPAQSALELSIRRQTLRRDVAINTAVTNMDLGAVYLDSTPPEVSFADAGQTVTQLPYSMQFTITETDLQSSIDEDSLLVRVNGNDVTHLFQLTGSFLSANFQYFPDFMVLGNNQVHLEVKNTSRAKADVNFDFDLQPQDFALVVNLVDVGSPVAGQVSFAAASYVDTDASGQIVFNNLSQGSYQLKARVSDLGARAIANVGVTPTAFLTIELDPVASYTGEVRLVDSSPAANATVWVGPFWETADAMGVYSFDLLPLSAHALFGKSGAQLGYLLGPELTLSGQLIIDVDVQLEGSGQVQGVVYDDDGLTPVPNAEVTLTTPGLPSFFDRATTSDASGAYALNEVIARHANLTALDPVTERMGFAESDIIADQVNQIDIVLAPARDLFGILLDSQGQPLPDHTVELSGPRSGNVQTEALGQFRFEDLPMNANYSIYAEQRDLFEYLELDVQLLEADLDVGSLTMAVDQPPVINLLTVTDPLDPVAPVYMSVDVSDDRRLSNWDIRFLDGATSVGHSYGGLNGTTWVRTRSVDVNNAVTASQLTYNFTVTDHWDQTTVVSQTVNVVLDAEPPVVAITAPLAGSEFFGGDRMTIRVDATDNFSVDRVELSVASDPPIQLSDQNAPFQFTIDAPFVATATNVPFTVTAYDQRDNSAVAASDFQLLPLTTTGVPELTLNAPVANQPLPIWLTQGLQLRVAAEASDPDGLWNYTLFINDIEVQSNLLSGTTDLIDATYVIGPEFRDLTSMDVSLLVRDIGGQSTRRDVTIQNILGVSLEALVIGVNDFQYDGQSLILVGGSHLIDGDHQFQNLVLVNGAELGQTATHDVFPEVVRTQLQIDEHFVVDYGSIVNFDGAGYSGLPPELNIATGTASHAGLAHDGTNPAEIYGSPFQPNRPGSYWGGGCLRVIAPDQWILGDISSDGARRTSSPHWGSGGSIWLSATQFHGFGNIGANGYPGKLSQSSFGGSGGRVAIEGDFQGTVMAVGGKQGNAGGAAGTVYRRTLDASKPDGYLDELSIQNDDVNADSQPTLLQELGPFQVDQDVFVRFETVGPDTFQVLDIPAGWNYLDVAGFKVVSDVDPVGVAIMRNQSTELWLAANETLVLNPGNQVRLVAKFDHIVIGKRAVVELAGKLSSPSLVIDNGTLAGRWAHADVSAIEPVLLNDIWIRGSVQFADLITHAGFTLDIRGSLLTNLFDHQVGDVTLDGEIVANTLNTGVGANILTPAGLLGATITLDANALSLAGNVEARRNGMVLDTSDPEQLARSRSHGGVGYLPTSTKTYGSLYDPKSQGNGATHAGGIINILAQDFSLDGSLNASSTSHSSGGTVHVSATTMAGAGQISANGCSSCNGGGGGGRIALLVNDPSLFIGLVEARAQSGGGAGTVYYRTDQWPLGRLVVDNGGLDGGSASQPKDRETLLPGLGVRTAGQATGGTEILGSDFADSLSGLHLVVDGFAPLPILENTDTQILPVTSFPSIEAGGSFSGLHRLNVVEIRGNAHLVSIDPIEVTDELIFVDGSISAPDISYPPGFVFRDGSITLDAPLSSNELILDNFHMTVPFPLSLDSIQLLNGSTLVYREPISAQTIAVDASTLQAEIENPVAGIKCVDLSLLNGALWTVSDLPATTSDPYAIDAEITGTLLIDSSSSITTGLQDKNIRKRFEWPLGVTYNPSNSDISHAGVGRLYSGMDAKSSGSFARPNRFGSVYGGGLVQLNANHMQIDGSIQANGFSIGSGGSIHLQSQTLAGAGRVEAKPAHRRSGGGRIAVHYANDASFRDTLVFDTAFDTVEANSLYVGGAGTVFFQSASQEYGELIVDQKISSATTSSSPQEYSARRRFTAVPGFDEINLFSDTTPQDLTTITDPSWSLPPDLTGLTLIVDSPTPFESRILASTFTSITVDRDLPKPIADGTPMRLVLKLDKLTLRNGGQLYFEGEIEVTELNLEGTYLNSVWAKDLLGLPDQIQWIDQKVRFILDQPSWQSKQIEANNTHIYIDKPLEMNSLSLVNSQAMHSLYDSTDLFFAPRFELTADSVVMDSSSSIDVSARVESFAHNGIRNSHGGVGTSTETTYGSLFRPIDYGSANSGELAGGAVRLQVNNLSEATINAAGDRGAGGSIWIEANHIAGDLNLDASVSRSFTRGGGGRIAVNYDQLDGVIIADARGIRSAGTIYQRHRPSQPFGLLTIQDMTGSNPAATRLPGFAPATLAAGFTQDYDLASDRTSLRIPALTLTENFVDHHLMFQGNEAMRFVIVDQQQQGSDALFTLAGEVPSLAIGDAYQLAVVLDDFDLCATCSMGVENVRLIVIDDVPPVIDMVTASPLIGGVLDSGQLFDVEVTGSDNQALNRAEISWDGQVFTLMGDSPYQLQLQAPVVGVATDMQLSVVLFDAGDLASLPANQMIQVVEPDMIDPVPTIESPTAGTQVSPDTPFIVTVSASDNRLVSSISITFNGETSEHIYAEGTWGQAVDFNVTAPSSGGIYPIQLSATDLQGNMSSVSIDIEVDASDTEAPVITVLMPTQSSAAEGDVLAIEVELSDASAIQSAQATLLGTVAQLTESGGVYLGSLPVSAPMSLIDAASISIEASDIHGNSSMVPVPMQVTASNYALPTLHVNAPAQGSTVESLQAAVIALELRYLNEDAEAPSPGWSHTASSRSVDWRLDSVSPHLGLSSWRIPDQASNVASLNSPFFTPANGSKLSFWNKMTVNPRVDAGQLFVETYLAKTGKRVVTAVTDFEMGGYKDVINQSSNPAFGQQAWTGNFDYEPCVVDLSPWQGQAIRLTWRYSSNSTTNGVYWAIDDIRVSHLGGPANLTQFQVDIDGNLFDLEAERPYLPVIAPNVAIATTQSWRFLATTPDNLSLEISHQFNLIPDATAPELELIAPASYAVVNFGDPLQVAPLVSEPSQGLLVLGFEPPYAGIDNRSANPAGFENLMLAQDHVQFDLLNGNNFDASVETTALVVPNAGRLTFSQSFSQSQATAGSIMEISTDGGANWSDLALSVVGGYDGVFGSSTAAGWEDRPCWTPESNPNIEVDLSSYAGQRVQLRWSLRKVNFTAVTWTLTQAQLSGVYADDASRIDVVEFDYAGSQLQDTSLPFTADFVNPSPLGTETQVITITARDLIGNQSQLTRPILVVGSQTQQLSSAQIMAGDATYDGQDILLHAGSHSIEGSHQFASLVLQDGAVMSHAMTSDVMNPAGLDLNIAGSFVVANNAQLDVDGLGYPQDMTDPSLGLLSGHGHAGLGQGEDEGSYGSVVAPFTVGSATGGGRIRIQANELIINGAIHADGKPYNGQFGSGGSIHLIGNTSISGQGTISANGYSGNRASFVGGGGGRIALTSNGSLDFSGSVSAFGGREAGSGTIYRFAPGIDQCDVVGFSNDESRHMTPLDTLDVTPQLLRVQHARVSQTGPLPGTSFEVTDGELGFDLAQLVDLRGRLLNTDARLSGDLMLDLEIIIPGSRNRGSLELAGTINTGSLNLVAAQGNQEIGFVGTWNAPSLINSNVTIRSMDDYANEAMRFQITGNMSVSYDAVIDARNGAGINANRYSHGGFGLQYLQGGAIEEVTGESPYGSFYAPNTPGGVGGIIHIESNQLTVDGVIKADGSGLDGAGGSAGSVNIEVNQLLGSGTISAHGGQEYDVGNIVEVAGSGGRIAIRVNQVGGDQFSGQVSANGAGIYPSTEMFAAPGTIYRVNDQYPQGHLLIDGGWGLIYQHGRTVLPSLGLRTVGTDDTDLDNLLVDATQQFTASLKGRALVHESGPVVNILDNDETSILGDQPFMAFTSGETYWGRHHVSQLTVNWDLVSEDEIVYDSLDHQDGVIDVLNFVVPKTRLLEKGTGEWQQRQVQEELVLDQYELRAVGPLRVGRLEMRAGSRLILDPHLPAHQLVADELVMLPGSQILVAASNELLPPLSIVVRGQAVIRQGASIDGSGSVLRPDMAPSHGGIGSTFALESLYDSPVYPRRSGGGPTAGAAINLQAEVLSLEGDIKSDGFAFSSGGSILLTLSELKGNGRVSAIGGQDGQRQAGGGRIAIHADHWHRFAGSLVTGQGVEAGTIVLHRLGSEELHIAANYPQETTDQPLSVLAAISLKQTDIHQLMRNQIGTVLIVADSKHLHDLIGLRLFDDEISLEVMDVVGLDDKRTMIQLRGYLPSGFGDLEAGLMINHKSEMARPGRLLLRTEGTR